MTERPELQQSLTNLHQELADLESQIVDLSPGQETAARPTQFDILDRRIALTRSRIKILILLHPELDQSEA